MIIEWGFSFENSFCSLPKPLNSIFYSISHSTGNESLTNVSFTLNNFHDQ